MAAVCGPGPARQGGQPSDARAPHQPLDPGAPDAAAVAMQDGVQAGRAIGPAALGMDQPDILGQGRVGCRPWAQRTSAPCVVAAGRQAEYGANHPDRPDLAMLIDEPKPRREAAPTRRAAKPT